MTIHIKKAYLCLNCETIFQRELLKEDCPVCASFSVWPMESWIADRSEFKCNKSESEGDLSNKHKTALMTVSKGADVFNYHTSKILLECEKQGLVEICKARGNYDPLRTPPYFGAIITSKGKKLIEEVSVNG